MLVLVISVCAVISVPLAHQHHGRDIHEPSDAMDSMSVDVVQRVTLGEEIYPPSAGNEYIY